MKRIKWLLTIPAISMTTIPTVAGCSCNKNEPVTVTLSGSNIVLTQKDSPYAAFEFNMSQSVNTNNISAVATRTGGTYEQAVKVYGHNVNDKKLSITVKFDGATLPNGGDNAVFKLEIKTNDNTTTFENLELVYQAQVNPIPEKNLKIQGTTLTGLSDDCKTIYYDTLEIPETVTKIQANAFSKTFTTVTNPTITTIKLNKNLTEIGANAFEGCTAIKTLNVFGLTEAETLSTLTIGENVFLDWNATGAIVYGNDKGYHNSMDYLLIDAGLNSKWFKQDAVRPIPVSDLHCSNVVLYGLTEDTIKNPPKHLALCNQLLVPKQINRINAKAFVDESTTPISTTIPKNIKSIKFTDDNLVYIEELAFAYAPFEGTIELQNKVKTIGNKAFYNCTGITDLGSEHTSLEEIGESAFEGCSNLSTVWFPSTVTKISNYAFRNCISLIAINVKNLNSVPDNWSIKETFKNISATGWVFCKISKSASWLEYFIKSGIEFDSWQITDFAELATGYEQEVAPAESQSVSNVRDFYLDKIWHDKQILADDIYMTLYDLSRKEGTNECKFYQLNAKIDSINIQAFEEGKCEFTADITLHILKTKDSDPIFVKLQILQMYLYGMSETKEDNYWKFTNSTLGTDERYGIKCTQTIFSSSVKHSYYYIDNETIANYDFTNENSVGVLLANLGLVNKDGDGKYSFNIHSYYCKNIEKI